MNLRIGHSAPVTIGVVLTVVVIMVVYPLSMVATLGILVPALVLVLWSWVAMRKHDRGLCTLCKMPDNPSAEAEKRARQLKVAHLSLTTAVCWMCAVVGFDLALALFPTKESVTLFALGNLSLLYLLRSHLTHRKLQPWCVKCRQGGTHIKHRELVLT